MAIKGHLDQPTGDERASPRLALRLETSGVAAGSDPANVTIHNISAAGLLIETALDLSVGDQLAVDLPEAGSVSAAIVWRSDRLYGCSFARALGPAALAAAQLQGVAAAEWTVPAAPAPRAAAQASEALGLRINRLRREAGLTLADIAGALGVSKPTVWAWEKGKARPLPERIEAIAAALGVPAETLARSGGTDAIGAVVDECRQRIADAYGTDPSAVRIMIEI